MQLNSPPDNKLSAGYMSASDTGGIEKVQAIIETKKLQKLKIEGLNWLTSLQLPL